MVFILSKGGNLQVRIQQFQILGIAHIDANENDITISFYCIVGNKCPDFDSDIENFSITIAGSELTDGLPITTSVLPITAVNDAETLTVAWATPPGTNGAEATLKSEIVLVTVNGGSFIEDELDEITLSGEAADLGLEVSYVEYNTHWYNYAKLHLWIDPVDFDENKTFVVNVPASAYAESGRVALTSEQLTCTAEIEE